ncbi:MAG: heavy-metal-associated domain-containing protein [Actinomycetota bacterium]|nr:heavy-metal-associated domain-containing protein [Actinomycetota bacterium]
MNTLDVTAADISCDHCKRHIEHDLGEVRGVRSVVVDVETKAVHVEYEGAETDDGALRSKLDEIGYPAT